MDLRAAIDRAGKAELLEGVALIAHKLAVLDAASASAPPEDDVFLSPKQLAERVPYTVGSLNTYVHAGKLIEGYHYFKKGHRTVFSWKAMKAWITATKEVTNQEPEIEPFITTRRRTS